MRWRQAHTPFYVGLVYGGTVLYQSGFEKIFAMLLKLFHLSDGKKVVSLAFAIRRPRFRVQADVLLSLLSPSRTPKADTRLRVAFEASKPSCQKLAS